MRAVGNNTTEASQMSDAALMQVESQVSVLTSDSVLRRVVVAEGLDHDPEFARGPSLLSSLTGKSAIPGGNTLAALNELKRRVVAKRAERTFVVDVQVTSRDAMKAVHLANAIAQAYLDEQTQERADAARQVSQSLSARLQDLKDRVRQSEQKVEAYRARNNLVGVNGQLVTDQQLTEMNNQLGAARAHTADAKARLDQVEQVQRTKDETRGLSRSAAIGDDHIAAQPICRDHAARSRANGDARPDASGGHRHSGAGRTAATHDRR